MKASNQQALLRAIKYKKNIKNKSLYIFTFQSSFPSFFCLHVFILYFPSVFLSCFPHPFSLLYLYLPTFTFLIFFFAPLAFPLSSPFASLCMPTLVYYFRFFSILDKEFGCSAVPVETVREGHDATNMMRQGG